MLKRKRTGKNNANYKHGKCITFPLCIDCGKQLGNYNAKRCRSCHISELNKKRWTNEDFRTKMKKLISIKAKKRLSIPENNPNWKGGLKGLYRLIRDLEEYKIWRNKVFKRDYYTCQECLQISIGNIEVHHKKHFAILLNEFLQEYNQFSPIEDKEILVRLAINWKPFWEISNGKTLCEKCHHKKGKHINA
jgi:5-methylcytosine-specific restriction endonuclease McrA